MKPKVKKEIRNFLSTASIETDSLIVGHPEADDKYNSDMVVRRCSATDGYKYYGHNSKFDFSAKTKKEVIEKLERWGYDRIVGWE